MAPTQTWLPLPVVAADDAWASEQPRDEGPLFGCRAEHEVRGCIEPATGSADHDHLETALLSNATQRQENGRRDEGWSDVGDHRPPYERCDTAAGGGAPEHDECRQE